MVNRDIPFHFRARPYQVPFLDAMQYAIEGKGEVRYFMRVWHRRAGKDKVSIADVIPRRLIQDPCLVKYVYPTLVMGRENLWEAMGKDGFPYKDHIPDFIRAKAPNETRMTIPIIGGSRFQISGSDHPDSLRGGNCKLYTFSEWSEQDPYAWDVVEPILRENGGIADFNLTPKGDNHARAMYEYAKNNPKWFVQLLTAKDTGVFTDRELEEIQIDITKRFSAQGRSDSEATAYFEQEYMCSFKAPVIGSYYGEAVTRAEREGRITSVPVYEAHNIHTAWDLGMDDSTTIWFFQFVGKEIHFVDYYENSGEGLNHYAQVLQQKGYVYGSHFAPHDIEVRELGTGKSRLEIANKMGIKFKVGTRMGIEDGINAGRSIFSRCWFDEKKCQRGINALKNYKKDWDEKNQVFRNNPLHNWASHGADAFRTFAVDAKQIMPMQQQTSFGGFRPYSI